MAEEVAKVDASKRSEDRAAEAQAQLNHTDAKTTGKAFTGNTHKCMKNAKSARVEALVRAKLGATILTRRAARTLRNVLASLQNRRSSRRAQRRNPKTQPEYARLFWNSTFRRGADRWSAPFALPVNEVGIVTLRRNT
jgi:hypothetical protein